MAKNTERLDLYMKEPETDGNDTFNITTMLNNNWEKIDNNVATVDEDGKVVNKDGSPTGEVLSVNDKKGNVNLGKDDVGLKNVDNVKQASKTEFDEHANDDDKHVTKSDKTKWDNHVSNKNNPHNVSSQQVTMIDYKKADELGTGYPTGVTSFLVNGSGRDDGYPANYGSVLNVKAGTSRFVQYFSNDGYTASQEKVWFRFSHHSVDGQWTEFKEIETTAGSQSKVDAHASLTNNPHSVTKSQVGLGSVPNYGVSTKEEAEAGTSDSKLMTPLRTKEAIEELTPEVFDPVRGNAYITGNPSPLGTSAIAIGKGSESTSLNSIAIGERSQAHGEKSIAIGSFVRRVADQSIALGTETIADTTNCIAIGYLARANYNTDPEWASSCISIGRQAMSKSSGVSLGDSAKSDVNSIAIGYVSDASGNNSVAIGKSSSSSNSREGVLGTSGSSGANKWMVPGNFTVQGTKNFEIDHPKPEKKATHRIRHGAVESPTAGDTLYRYTVTATSDDEVIDIDLPDYFVHLNKDVQIWANGKNHFGNGFGEYLEQEEKVKIHCEKAGDYNVLIIGTRNDDNVQDWSIMGVEREQGISWTGESYNFEVDEIIMIDEIKEEEI